MLRRQQTPINFRQIQGTILFRSSRPCGGVCGASYSSLGIKTVFDLRNLSEVRGDTGLSQHFTTYCINADRKGGYKERQVEIAGPSVTKETGDKKGRHLLISIVSFGRLFMHAAWYIKIRVVFAYIWDIIFGTQYAYGIILRNVVAGYGDRSLINLYRHIIDHSGSQIAVALKILSRPESVPALICCSMGKDRTGVLCAIVGHICGRSKCEIADDYALSQEHYDEQPSHELLQEINKLCVDPSFKDSPRCVMMELLHYVDEKYGSFDAYLDGIGFGTDDREALSKNVKCAV